MDIIPHRRRSLESSPRGPFGLSALSLYVIIGFLCFAPGTRATYWVVDGGWVGSGWWIVGGEWWVGRVFEKY